MLVRRSCFGEMEIGMVCMNGEVGSIVDNERGGLITHTMELQAYWETTELFEFLETTPRSSGNI